MGIGKKDPIRPIHIGETNYPRVLDRTHDILNGGISIGSVVSGQSVRGNLDNIIIPVTAPNIANTEFVLTHNLNRIPTGARIVSMNVAAIIYESGTPWTTSQVFLKCNFANAVLKVEVF